MGMHRSIVTGLLIRAPSLGTTSPSLADTELPSFLEMAFQWLGNGVLNPPIAGLVQVGGRVEADVAVGVRALNWSEAATVDDQ
jgi:hypothetical protein